MKNYTVYHLHSDYSNCVTNIDSVTKPIDYIKRAKELGMKSIAFSEHGCILNWVEKKVLAESHGLKYIHGAEIYLTNNKPGEKKTRDNYHCGVYAKNYAGVLEINELLTKANNKTDHHYYYNPRVTFEELYGTSENVIITTACIGGVLHNGDKELKAEFIQFLTENKHRCFLEIQHHQDKAQIAYNKYLLDLSKWSGLRLIAGTDTHALNETHAKGRKILQKSKSINFEDEDGWDITFKTYDELLELYKKQGIFELSDITTALENTNVLADMVEEFELDKAFKYPKLFDNSTLVLKQQIMNGINSKHINLYSNYQTYIDRVKYELETYQHQGMEDFLLLDADIKTFGRSEGIYCGPGRGSVTGSLIAYLIGITEIDPIKEKLNFERFANKERISLGDIDSDWPPSKREVIKNYVFNKPGLHCAEIVTFNTVALKGSIRDVCRALFTTEPPQELREQYDRECAAYGHPTDITSRKMRAYVQGYLEVSNYICKNIDDGREEQMRKEFPEVFEYVDIVNGTIVSMGSHPCGSVISPIELSNSIGTISLNTTERPVTALSMKMIDMLNFLKLDILGLDNIEIINETCKLAGIERLTPENVPDDENVWKAMRENTIGMN